MKKLMFTAVAALAAGIAFADGEITSQNVVGYQNIKTSDTYYTGGPTFTFIGSTAAAGNYRLGDFKALNMDISADSIQFLTSDGAVAYVEATYAGSEYGALEGWWDFNNPGVDPLDDQEFPNGTAFLASFTSGNEIEFTYAGQVATGSDVVVVIPEGTTYPFVCNPTPVDLTLGQVKAEGMDISADSFQYLTSDGAVAYVEATYAGSEYGALEGWWDFNNPGVDPLDEQDLPAGAGLLGSITSGNEITLTFPDPLK